MAIVPHASDTETPPASGPRDQNRRRWPLFVRHRSSGNPLRASTWHWQSAQLFRSGTDHYGVRMKTLKTIALLSMFLLPACGDASAGVLDKVGDAAKQSDALAKIKGTFTNLTSTLTGITDGETAKAAKGKLEGMIGPLKDQLSSLGGLSKLGAMKDTLVNGVMSQVTRLIGNADIKSAIGPVLEKLKGVLNG